MENYCIRSYRYPIYPRYIDVSEETFEEFKSVLDQEGLNNNVRYEVVADYDDHSDVIYFLDY